MDQMGGPEDGCTYNGRQSLYRIRCQQGGGGVMIWAGVIGNEVIGPFKVEEGVKLNSVNYCAFLAQNFKQPWLLAQNEDRKEKMIFMQDNAPSHASRYSKTWLGDKGFINDSLMDLPANSPDLNPIEHYWKHSESCNLQRWKAIHLKN